MGITESIANETDVNIEGESTKDENTENSQDTFIITKEPTQPTKTMKPTKPKLENGGQILFCKISNLIEQSRRTATGQKGT